MKVGTEQLSQYDSLDDLVVALISAAQQLGWIRAQREYQLGHCSEEHDAHVEEVSRLEALILAKQYEHT